MESVEALQTLVFMSVVVEALTAIVRQFISNKASELVTMSVGITLCFAYKVGIFIMLGMQTDYPAVD